MPGPIRAAAAGSGDWRPRLAPQVRLHRDEARRRWVLLAPEQVLAPDEIALAVLRLCDGRRSLAQIAEELAAEYDAPAGQIESDIEEMLRDLADRGLVTA